MIPATTERFLSRLQPAPSAAPAGNLAGLALEEAKPWWNLDDFSLLVRAEQACGRTLS